MTQARIALVACLALVAVAGAATMSASPARVVHTGARPEQTLAATTQPTSVCQSGETLPARVSAIRIGLEGSLGPPVLLRALWHGSVIASGSRAGDWTDDTVTIPVNALDRSVYPVKLCFYVRQNSELLQLYGAKSAREPAYTGNGEALLGRFSVEYLSSSGRSWWSHALAVARHMGLGHAITGTWVAVLVALLVATFASLTVRLGWRHLP